MKQSSLFKQYKIVICIAPSIFFYASTHTDTVAIERLSNKLNLNASTCKPLLQTPKNNAILNQQVACFATDKVSVLHLSGNSFDSLKKRLEPAVQAAINQIRPQISFVTYTARDNSYTNHLIFYREQDDIAQKNGLLLGLYLLNVSTIEATFLDEAIFPSNASKNIGITLPDTIKTKVQSAIVSKHNTAISILPTINEYLVGSLLGLSDDNIKFLYQRHFFISIDNPLNIPRPSTQEETAHTGIWYDPLEAWPKEQREAFKQYVEANEKWNIEFNNDKAMATIWLTKYKGFSRAELRAGVDLMGAYISWQQSPKKYAKKPHIRKILESAIRLQKLVGQMQGLGEEKQSQKKNNRPQPAWIQQESDMIDELEENNQE